MYSCNCLHAEHPILHAMFVSKVLGKFVMGCRCVGLFERNSAVPQWKAGKRHGKGKLSKVNGDGYNGMWKDGNPDMQMLKNVHR